MYRGNRVATLGSGECFGEIALIVPNTRRTASIVADDFVDTQGKWEKFAQVNIADNTTAHLAFSFVDHYDDWELPLDKFYLSFFDVDQQRDPRRHRERWTLRERVGQTALSLTPLLLATTALTVAQADLLAHSLEEGLLVTTDRAVKSADPQAPAPQTFLQ